MTFASNYNKWKKDDDDKRRTNEIETNIVAVDVCVCVFDTDYFVISSYSVRVRVVTKGVYILHSCAHMGMCDN